MSKVLTIGGLVVSGLLTILFGFDLAISIPFGRVSLLMDISFLCCALMLAYMSWATMRDWR